MDSAEANELVDKLLGKAADQYSKDFKIPTYGGVSTAGAKKEVAKAKDSRDELDTVINTERTRVGEANKTQKNAETDIGESGADKAMADQAAAETIAANYRMSNAIFGVGLDGSDAIAIKAARNKELMPQLDADRANIRSMQAVGPLDNPLEWLFNGIQLPSVISQFNNDANEFNTNAAMIQQGIADSTQLAMNVNRGLPSITMAQAKATADKARAEARKAGALADDALARTNVAFSVQKLSADMSIADATLKTTALDAQQAHQRYQSQVTAIQLADSHAARLEQAAKLYDLVGQNKALDVLYANFDKIQGYPPGTTTRNSVRIRSKADQDNIIAIASGSFGNNPVDAWANARSAQFGPLVSEDTKKVFDYIGTQVNASRSTVMELIKTGKVDKDQERAKVIEGVNNLIAADQANAWKPGSMFHEFAPAKVIASGRIPADSELGKVLAPLADKDQEITSNVISRTLLVAYNGDTAKAGAALATYYKQNMQLRNETLPMAHTGIKLMEGYKVPVGTGIFDKAQLDLTKPGDAVKYMIYQDLQSKLHPSDIEVDAYNQSKGRK